VAVALTTVVLAGCGGGSSHHVAFRPAANRACAAYLQSLGRLRPSKTLKLALAALRNDIAARERLIAQIRALDPPSGEAALVDRFVRSLEAIGALERQTVRLRLGPGSALPRAIEVPLLNHVRQARSIAQTLRLDRCAAAANG
jgi:hypothetical protein